MRCRISAKPTKDSWLRQRGGVGIANGKYVVVRDEYTALDKSITVRWVMLTSAEVKITGTNTAELSKDGKKLTMKVIASKDVKMKTWSTAPANDYDAENPGTVMVGFEMKVSPREKVWENVLLVPGSATIVDDKQKTLGEW